MTYYKGLIINKRMMKDYEYSELIGSSSIQYDGVYLFSIFNQLEANKKSELRKLLSESINRNCYNIQITDKNLINYFNNYYNLSNLDIIQNINKLSKSLGTTVEIIYELVKDKDGYLFAKELYTKQLFPIYNKKCEVFNYDIKYNSNNDNYNLYIKPTIEVSSLLKCENFIVGHKIADLNDYDRYVNMFKSRRILKKQDDKRREIFKQSIIKFANENVFKEDFKLEDKKEKKEIIKVNQNIETSLMEDIEYSLMKLKDIDNDLYLEYKNKYDILLNKEVNKEGLAFLLGELEYSLIFKKRNIDGILDYINNLKNEYLDNLINNHDNKTDINLKKIDKISELFLNIKNKFSLLNQREVLKKIAFLYLMEVYENIDIITIEELNDSYFSSNLKSIIMWINYLIEQDIIECDYIVSLREELTTDIVLDVIRNINLKNKQLKIKNML